MTSRSPSMAARANISVFTTFPPSALRSWIARSICFLLPAIIAPNGDPSPYMNKRGRHYKTIHIEEKHTLWSYSPRLCEAHGEHVDVLHDFSRFNIERHHCVHQSRSVHVHLQAVLVRQRSNLHGSQSGTVTHHHVNVTSSETVNTFFKYCRGRTLPPQTLWVFSSAITATRRTLATFRERMSF